MAINNTKSSWERYQEAKAKKESQGGIIGSSSNTSSSNTSSGNISEWTTPAETIYTGANDSQYNTGTSSSSGTVSNYSKSTMTSWEKYQAAKSQNAYQGGSIVSSYTSSSDGASDVYDPNADYSGEGFVYEPPKGTTTSGTKTGSSKTSWERYIEASKEKGGDPYGWNTPSSPGGSAYSSGSSASTQSRYGGLAQVETPINNDNVVDDGSFYNPSTSSSSSKSTMTNWEKYQAAKAQKESQGGSVGSPLNTSQSTSSSSSTTSGSSTSSQNPLDKLVTINGRTMTANEAIGLYSVAQPALKKMIEGQLKNIGIEFKTESVSLISGTAALGGSSGGVSGKGYTKVIGQSKVILPATQVSYSLGVGNKILNIDEIDLDHYVKTGQIKTSSGNYNSYNQGKGYTGNEEWFQDAVCQLAKIVYREAGGTPASDPDMNFFMQLNVASIALNNSNSKKGNNVYEQMKNFSSSTYENYNSYKNADITSVIEDKEERERALYIAEQVLLGNYNLPSTMNLQASREIVDQYGEEWGHVDTKKGFTDIYYGHEKALNNKDYFGNEIQDNSFDNYMNLANKIEDNYGKVPDSFSYDEKYVGK